MNAIDAIEYEQFTSAKQPPSLWRSIRSWFSKTFFGTANTETDPATYSPGNDEERLNDYRQLLEEAKAIFVFRNGTAVFSNDAMTEAEAVELLREHGPVEVGTASADFFVAFIESPVAGFVVKYRHPQILSFANTTDEFPPEFPMPLAGSMIRLSRQMDSADLHVAARYQQTR